LIDPDDYSANAGGTALDDAIGRVYRGYQRRLRAANAMDFDDLIMNTVGLLQAFPAVAEHYRRRFRHIFVDEYQDTNHAQYVLVRELAGVAADAQVGAGVPRAALTVVGDADQSIYAFRGATIRNITEFETDYPDAATILLEQNYRSTQNILSAANGVIGQNPGRRPKNLWTAGGDGPKVVGYVADTEADEARFIAEEIDRLGEEESVRPGDVAVFYRTNAQSRALEEQLMRVGLPYAVVGGTRFYDRREIRDAIAYLRAVDNPADAVSMRRIFNVPRRGLGERTEALVSIYAERHNMSFGAALREDIPGISARAAKSIAAFTGLLDKLREMADEGAGPAAILDEALAASGYMAELDASDDIQDAGRKENLAELHAVAVEFERAFQDQEAAGEEGQGAAGEEDQDPGQSEDVGRGGLSDFLERVSLVADSDQLPEAGSEEAAAGQITLMTLHTAKGLEFPVVFLTGMEDGTLPHARSIAEKSELEEERRLAYVGLTRARERLYLSRAAVRTTWGRPQGFPPSRFLDDIPPEVMEWRRERASAERLRAGGSLDWSGASGWPGRMGRAGGSGGADRSRDAGGLGSSGKPGGKAGKPAFGSAEPLAEADIPALRVGDEVTHQAYGVGRVTAVEGEGLRAVARVSFPGEGVKRLLLRFAPVKKL
jgi:DNA helicase-2/ATP-dependent DNA helicase PcrA